MQKVKRTNLVVGKWLSSTNTSMPELNPESCDWYLDDGQYKIKWFRGNASPSIIDITVSEVSEEDK